MLRNIQDTLGVIPFDGVVITLLAYYLSPDDTKWRNAIIIGGSHGLLHGAVCKIQAEGGFM